MRVKFTNANSAASPTLNVNGTGAVSIMKFGMSAVSSFAWNAGLIVTFVYDGTNWLMDSKPESVGLLNGGIVLTNSDDMNNCQESGWYAWNHTAAPANAPFTTSYGALYVDQAGANTKQTVFRANLPGVTGPAEFVRYKFSTGTWTDWERVVSGYATYNSTTIGITGIQDGRVIGGIAFLRFYDFKPTSASYVLGTLPAGLKPSVNSYGTLLSADGANTIRAEVQTTGSVSIVHGDTGKYHYGTVVYPVV